MSDFRDCSTCDGTGRVWVSNLIGGSEVRCDDCHGKGYVRA